MTTENDYLRVSSAPLHWRFFLSRSMVDEKSQKRNLCPIKYLLFFLDFIPRSCDFFILFRTTSSTVEAINALMLVLFPDISATIVFIKIGSIGGRGEDVASPLQLLRVCSQATLIFHHKWRHSHYDRLHNQFLKLFYYLHKSRRDTDREKGVGLQSLSFTLNFL